MLLNPSTMRTTLKKDEKVALTTYPHWFTLVWPSVFTVIALVAAILIGSYGYLLPLVPLAYLGFKIWERRNNIWVVTNLRVIDEFGVLSLNSKESPLDKINNVSYEQSLWGRIFGYGNVQIQTAAEIGSTVYYMVEKPRLLKDTITLMQDEFTRYQVERQTRELARAMGTGGQQKTEMDTAAEIEKLHDLMQRGIISKDEFEGRKRRLLDL